MLSRFRYRGRHRGVFGFGLGFYKYPGLSGVHHRKYVEKWREAVRG